MLCLRLYQIPDYIEITVPPKSEPQKIRVHLSGKQPARLGFEAERDVTIHRRIIVEKDEA